MTVCDVQIGRAVKPPIPQPVRTSQINRAVGADAEHSTLGKIVNCPSCRSFRMVALHHADN